MCGGISVNSPQIKLYIIIVLNIKDRTVQNWWWGRWKQRTPLISRCLIFQKACIISTSPSMVPIQLYKWIKVSLRLAIDRHLSFLIPKCADPVWWTSTTTTPSSAAPKTTTTDRPPSSAACSAGPGRLCTATRTVPSYAEPATRASMQQTSLLSDTSGVSSARPARGSRGGMLSGPRQRWRRWEWWALWGGGQLEAAVSGGGWVMKGTMSSLWEPWTRARSRLVLLLRV